MSKRYLTIDELQELWNAGIVIHAVYIGPIEGTDYRVLRRGEWGASDTIAWRRSQRAAYNAAKKYIAAQQKMQPTGGMHRQNSVIKRKANSAKLAGSPTSG